MLEVLELTSLLPAMATGATLPQRRFWAPRERRRLYLSASLPLPDPGAAQIRRETSTALQLDCKSSALNETRADLFSYTDEGNFGMDCRPDPRGYTLTNLANPLRYRWKQHSRLLHPRCHPLP